MGPRTISTAAKVDRRPPVQRRKMVEDFQVNVLDRKKKPSGRKRQHKCSICYKTGHHPQTCRDVLSPENSERADLFFKQLIEKDKTNENQLGWLIGPLCVDCRGFPPPADVNRTLCGGGVPGDRTHTALSGSRSRCRSSRRSSAVGILSGGPSGSSNSSGCPFFQASEVQLPLLKYFPTMTTL